MENFKELNENELDNIVGGAHVYVDKSHPVTGPYGQGYEVYRCNMDLGGDWKNLINGKGAKKFHASLFISSIMVPIENYDRYIETCKKRSDTIHES